MNAWRLPPCGHALGFACHHFGEGRPFRRSADASFSRRARKKTLQKAFRFCPSRKEQRVRVSIDFQVMFVPAVTPMTALYEMLGAYGRVVVVPAAGISKAVEGEGQLPANQIHLS